MRIFNFEKINGKWKANISGKTAFYMFQTYGFPVEMFVEEVNKMPIKNFLLKIINDWKEFSKENNINVSEYQQEYKNMSKEDKDKMIKDINLINN